MPHEPRPTDNGGSQDYLVPLGILDSGGVRPKRSPQGRAVAGTVQASKGVVQRKRMALDHFGPRNH